MRPSEAIPDSVSCCSEFRLWPRFWDEGLFWAPRQYTHKNGLTFTWGTSTDGRLIALAGRVGAFYMTRCKRRRVRGNGASSPFFANRSRLPLRGKLGWMTPRVGVKATLTMERAFSGLPVPSGSPIFLELLIFNRSPR